MQNLFLGKNMKLHKRVSCPSSTDKCCRLLKFNPKEDKNIQTVHRWYHNCWWPGDAKDRDINRHHTDLVIPDDTGFNTRKQTATGTKWPPLWKQNFQRIFLFENYCISIQISLKFIAEGPIDMSMASFGLHLYANTGPKPTEHTVYILPVVSSKSTLFQHINMQTCAAIRHNEVYALNMKQLWP